MAPNEILNYTIEGIKWLAIGGASTYVGLLISCPVSMLFAEKIKEQKRLDVLVKKESDKLGLKGVKGILCDEYLGGGAYHENGNPIVELGGIGANRSTLRHELYHHFTGDSKHSMKNKWLKEARYMLIVEPRAWLYQSTGIKV
ncbi:hypothetical protein CL615_00310 [archaeon]|jgi:hypothetical protein|nr:hypothetical protein [archaeon]MDP6547429.1 hypothetical protein [Candidatus Woesearchaeota archaeon]|tara:strand:+ start:23320 stop:23748 length:429 start_codon:yes stop_codon:yes gene_type:complete